MPKKKTKAITYKVWICIEEYNYDTQSGQELNAPGAALEVFDTYEQAYAFAEELTNQHEGKRNHERNQDHRD